MKPRYRAHIVFILMLSLFAASRLASLDADPPMSQWIPGIGEEGFWGAPARNIVLFGDWRIDEYTTQHLLMTPLYSAMLVPIFKLFGTGLFQSRLLSAIFGILSAVLLYFFISRESRKAALLAVLFIFLDESFFSYNRLGLVETTLTFFIMLSAISFLLAKDNKLLVFLSGAAFATAAFVKIYGLFFVLAVPFLYYANVKKGLVKNNMKNHAGNILCFALGALLVCLVLALFFYLPEIDRATSFGSTMGGMLGSRIMAENALNLIISPFFASLSVAILFIFSLMYLLHLKPLVQIPEYQLLAVVLFFVTFIAALLTTFSVRRLVPLLIPISILAAGYLAGNKDSSKIPNTNTNAAALALFASILAQSVFFEFGLKYYFAAASALFVSLLLALILAKNSKIASHFNYARSAVCVAAFALFVISVRTMLSNAFNYVSFAVPAILALCATAFVYFMFYNKKFAGILVLAFVVFNVLVVGTTIFQPAYSIKEASIKISEIAGNSTVTGQPAYHLSYEGNYVPLWYSPHYGPSSKINQGKMGSIKYLIAKDNYLDENYIHLRPNEANATYIDTFSILWGKMKYHIYKIN